MQIFLSKCRIRICLNYLDPTVPYLTDIFIIRHTHLYINRSSNFFLIFACYYGKICSTLGSLSKWRNRREVRQKWCLDYEHRPFLWAAAGQVRCGICQKICLHSGNMKQHFETHHYRSGSQVCPFCQKTFRTKHSLQSHLSRSHRKEKSLQPML